MLDQYIFWSMLYGPQIWILYLQNFYIYLHLTKILEKRMERNNIVDCNDKIHFKNKLDVGNIKKN
jgi:hypothetical protein